MYFDHIHPPVPPPNSSKIHPPFFTPQLPILFFFNLITHQLQFMLSILVGLEPSAAVWSAYQETQLQGLAPPLKPSTVHSASAGVGLVIPSLFPAGMLIA